MFPNEYRYTKTHEWIMVQGDVVTIGVTNYAQEQLGDIVYLELPKVGTEVKAKQSMGTIEAVKTVADLFAPVTGTVSAVNTNLEQHPDLVNQDPLGDGWFVRVKMKDRKEFDALMDRAAYQSMIGK